MHPSFSARSLRWFLLVFLPLIPAAAPLPAPAGEIAVVTEIWPPFRIGNPDRPESISGIDIELLEMLTRRLGATYRIRRLPWARCLEFMRSGRADLITGVAHNPKRAKFIRYSRASYHSVSPAFYVREGRGKEIRSYADLSGVTIGHSLQSVYFEPFDSDDALQKIGVSTEKQLIQMLARGRLDAIIGTNANVEYDIAVMGLRGKIERTVYQPEKRTRLYLGISRKSPLMARAAEIDQLLAQILRRGMLLPILEDFFIASAPGGTAPPPPNFR
jgi:polar amino acid transport system substrate-binding protein